MAGRGKSLAITAAIFFVLSLAVAYLFNRYGDLVATCGLPLIEAFSTSIDLTIPAIQANPFYINMTDTNVLLATAGGFLAVWLVWLYTCLFQRTTRQGEESGSARWGTKAEGQAFMNKADPSMNILFTKNYGMAVKRKGFDPELDRNVNVMVIGGSGSGKTRGYIKPNLCQLNASYFVTDPKGTLIEETGAFMVQSGYRIKSFDTIHFDRSMHYNPLAYVKTDADIISFVECLIKNTNGEKPSGGDKFWEDSEKLLYTALIAFMRDWMPRREYSLSGLLTLLDMAKASEDNEGFKSPLDLLFEQISTGKKYTLANNNKPAAADSPRSTGSERGVAVKGAKVSKWAWQPTSLKRNSDGVTPKMGRGLTPQEDYSLSCYEAFKTAAGKTLKSIIISCNVRLLKIRTDEVRELLTYDEMELDTMGDKFVVEEIVNENGRPTGEYRITDIPQPPMIVYGVLSDTDKAFSFLFAIMMWQTIDQLCRKALTVYGGKLPQFVNMMFDEFANIGYISSFNETIAVTRSRNIGVSIVLQSLAQLDSRYDKDAKTIIDCCDTTLFLGGKSNTTNKEIAEMIGKQTIGQTTFNQSKGQSPSTTKNMQIQGRDLMDAAEIAKLSRRKAILLIAGANPLIDFKYPLEEHPNYTFIDPGHRPTGFIFKKKAYYQKPFSFKEYRNAQRKEAESDKGDTGKKTDTE